MNDDLRGIVDHNNKVEHDHQLQVASIGKSEAERAADLKQRTFKALIEVCAIMDEGLREGLLIRWMNIAINPYGRHEVTDLHVEKRF